MTRLLNSKSSEISHFFALIIVCLSRPWDIFIPQQFLFFSKISFLGEVLKAPKLRGSIRKKEVHLYRSTPPRGGPRETLEHPWESTGDKRAPMGAHGIYASSRETLGRPIGVRRRPRETIGSQLKHGRAMGAYGIPMEAHGCP